MRYILFFLLFISFWIGNVFAKEEFQIEVNNFSCSEQMCFFPLKSWYNLLEISLKVKWFANIWYWYKDKYNQIKPLKYLPIHWYKNLQQKYSFYISQKNREKELYFVVFLPEPLIVEFKPSDFIIIQTNLNFWEKIIKFFHDLITIDNQYRVFDIYYWIGTRPMWISIIMINYILFWILTWIILIVLWWKKWSKIVLFMWIGLFILIGVRDLVDHTAMVKRWLTEYTFSENKEFFDIGPEYSLLIKNLSSIKYTFSNPNCSMAIPIMDYMQLLYFLPIIYPCRYEVVDPNRDPGTYANKFQYVFINKYLFRNR